MEDQLWNLFRETGDPMGYLLYRAEQLSREKTEADKAAQTSPDAGTPPASV